MTAAAVHRITVVGAIGLAAALAQSAAAAASEAPPHTDCQAVTDSAAVRPDSGCHGCGRPGLRPLQNLPAAVTVQPLAGATAAPGESKS